MHFNQNMDEEDDYDILINEIGKDDNPRFVDLEKLHFFLILCGIFTKISKKNKK